MRELIATATAQLADAGVASPRVDAALLAEYVFGIPALEVGLADTPQDAALVARYQELVARRARREPLQHILGRAHFYGLELTVGSGVFIPRPETEQLAEIAIQATRDAIARGVEHPIVVDACAGSGALGLAIAREVPAARVIAIEMYPQAVEFLRANVGAIDPRVEIIQSDATRMEVLESKLDQPGCVDVFVSNPPYVPTGHATDSETRADPLAAVFAADTGMAVIKPMARVAAHWLAPGGFFGVEHDETTQSRVTQAVSATKAFTNIQERHDLAGRPRFVTATRMKAGRSAT
ncbi:peptide chain release factor N(5)-glutamine methyltransferase [Corynebacterium sp. 13CS0277]|uniref:peptide chain release factor N(5)-glutamine methyltransferase n=1 Tax=Corynebacterium sp. 13CS0277 TaxID=2071994 RepID=UPI001E57722E|nr:peptide chain release factor N(5)-glutamine methyltransferase [Corynebacterium sp. 13CS0277]